MSDLTKRPYNTPTILNSTLGMDAITSLFTSSSSSPSFTTTTDPFDHPFYHPTDSLPWIYHNVLGAAPMVRISTLPFRLACKSYGANMLYSEELVALKLQHCTRVNNLYDHLPGGDLYRNDLSSLNNDPDDAGDTVSTAKGPILPPHQTTPHALTHFILDKNINTLAAQLHTIITKDSTVGSFLTPTELPELTDPTQLLSQYYKYTHQDTALRQLATFTANSELTTYQSERLVVQLGAGNAVDALNAALVVQNDCRAVDINLGCPKLFSTQALFGSELLVRPEIVEDIVKTLKRNISNPVSVKIRMLPDPRHTIDLIRRVEACGVEAIAVHARFKADRPRYQALPLEQMPLLCSIARVPLLYNGDIYSHHEIDQYKHICRGCWCDGADINDDKCTCGSERMNANGVHGVLIGRGAMHNPSIFGHYLEDPAVFGTRAGVKVLDSDNTSVSSIEDDDQALLNTNSNTNPLASPGQDHVVPHIHDAAATTDNDDVNPDVNEQTSQPLYHKTQSTHDSHSKNQSPPPPIWDPVLSLLRSFPTVGHFIPQQFLSVYYRQFTAPALFTQRKKYRLDHQTTRDSDTKLFSSTGRSGLLNKIEIDPQPTPLPTLLEPYQYTPTLTNVNPMDGHLKSLQGLLEDDPATTTLLFSHSTWPTQNNLPFVPPKRTDWVELLNEIDASIELRKSLQNVLDQSSRPQHTQSTDQSRIDAGTIQLCPNTEDQSSTTITEQPSPSTTTYPPDDFSLYTHRTAAYQHNDPSLNPWKPWRFGQSYYSIDFLAPNESLNTRQKPNALHQFGTLPMFYPASLIVALSLALSLQINNVKYIVNALLKWNNTITKDQGFRMTSQAKTPNDLWKALMAMIASSVTKEVLLDSYPHPQPINKHEVRPEPKQKKK